MTEYAMAERTGGAQPRVYLVPSSDPAGPTPLGHLASRPRRACRTIAQPSVSSRVESAALPAKLRRSASVAARPRRAVSPRPSSVRLTCRGRVVLRLVFIVLAVLLVAAVATQTRAMGAGSRQEHKSVVVGSGDTVWSIAARHAGRHRVPATVLQIAELNDLDGVWIEPGQRLLLP